MSPISDDDKRAIAARHHADQVGAIVPQSLRKLQATTDENGAPLYSRAQRREYLRRAERLERESGQR